jgi:TnpA family transposase
MDPRRRTPAVGTYTHVLDRGGIAYDHPIVLNKRQAGAAIEGALRQRMTSLRRVAVDTHGFTHVAMCIAKLIGLDLCPRLADLADRKLYLPKGFSTPPGLEEIVSPTVSRRTIERGWEAAVRVAASIDGGWCSPIQAIDKLGSSATGLPVYEAANALGKLYRSLYLCDYWTNDKFRQQILDLLNQGESVHSLQRALHNGLITAKRGRAPSELTAISGSLALMANIVMAYNTSRMDALYHQYPAEYDPRAMQHVAPIGYAHINLRGTLAFNLERFRDHLFTTPRRRRAA